MGAKAKEQQDDKPNASVINTKDPPVTSSVIHQGEDEKATTEKSLKEQEEKQSAAATQAQQEERQKIVHSDGDGNQGVVESDTNNNKVNNANHSNARGSDNDGGYEESEEDVVLVPMNPYLPPPFSAERSDRLKARQMERRKRLFAAKSVLLENPRNQKRRKRRTFLLCLHLLSDCIELHQLALLKLLSEEFLGSLLLLYCLLKNLLTSCCKPVVSFSFPLLLWTFGWMDSRL